LLPTQGDILSSIYATAVLAPRTGKHPHTWHVHQRRASINRHVEFFTASGQNTAQNTRAKMNCKAAHHLMYMQMPQFTATPLIQKNDVQSITLQTYCKQVFDSAKYMPPASCSSEAGQCLPAE
jgi:hypothetical protein